ncbi:MAG: MaoC family dehydratase [Acidimicrobiales bacterium]
MTVAGGDVIPDLTIEAVDPGRMKTMVALLHDPYPIHWNPAATAELGLGARLVNQGPLSLGYVTNMLMAWQGATCIRRINARFKAPVFAGDRVTAGGLVQEVIEVDGERRAVCEVWLDTPNGRAIEGGATVGLS